MTAADPAAEAGTVRRPRPSAGHLLLYAALVAGAVLVLLPFAYMLSTSLKSLNEVFKTPIQWLPKALRWDNFTTPLREQPIGHYFKNSLFKCILKSNFTSPAMTFNNNTP